MRGLAGTSIAAEVGVGADTSAAVVVAPQVARVGQVGLRVHCLSTNKGPGLVNSANFMSIGPLSPLSAPQLNHRSYQPLSQVSDLPIDLQVNQV